MDEATQQLLRQFIAAVAAERDVRKAVSSTPTAVYAHGSGGLFSQPPANPNVVTTMIVPRGLAGALEVRQSVYTNEILTILTGQLASTGENPTTACAPGPIPGNLKTCSRAFPFGRVVMDSPVLQIDRLGEQVNRGEFLDYRLRNNPFADLTDSPLPANGDVLNSEYQKQLLQLMVAIHRDYGPLLYTGNPANTAGSTGYIEYFGLDYQINTNYRDYTTGVLCTAADSYVQSLTGTNVYVNPDTVIQWVINIYEALQYRAQQVHLDAQIVPVMKHQLFKALAYFWPCVVASLRCVPGTDSINNIDSTAAMAMRNEMYNGHFLWINGRQVPVIVDDYIAETVPTVGVRESDIYFVPLVVNGAPGVYWEYFDLDNKYLQEVIDNATPADAYRTLSNGRYLMHRKAPTEWCLQWSLLWRPRVILEYPFLAARLTDVRYTPPVQDRHWDPDSPYDFVDGGNYSMSGYQPYGYTPRAT